MKLAVIGTSRSSTKTIPLDDIKYLNGKALELPQDPENNLAIDPRPVYYDRYGYTFEIKVRRENSESLVLMITRTDKNEGWDDDRHFRVYDRTKEDVPTAFDSSLPYDYWGLDRERAPYHATVVKVHRTVTTIKAGAFRGCEKMTMCDMSDAPVEEIEENAFFGCTSLRNITFSHSLRKIGKGAFWKCSAIECLIIPPTVTNIDWHAFRECTSMRMLRLPSSIDLNNVHKDIIYKCDALLSKVPDNKTPNQWLKDRYDQYPLHDICYSANVTFEEIEQCVEDHPNAVCLTDEFGNTFLHYLARNPFANANAIESLCQSDLDDKGYLAQKAGEDGCTALHYLARNKCATAEAIESLYHTFPSAATMKDMYGKCPLYYAVQNEGLVERGFDKALVLAQGEVGGDEGGVYPAQIADEDGCTALHYLAHNRYATGEAIESLYNTYPGAATMKDKDGNSPLHLLCKTACATTNKKKGIRALALARNENGEYAASILDRDENTATALAMRNASATDDIRAVIYSTWPIARTEFKDSEDRQRFENAIDKYIDDFQDNFAKKVEEGKTTDAEKFGFVRHICHYLDSNSGDDLEYIDKWVSFFGDTVKCPLPQLKIIAEWKVGREKVLEYAAPAIKEAIQERLAFLQQYDLVKGPVIHKSDTAIVIKAYDLKSTDFYKEKFAAFFNNDPARKQLGLDRAQFGDLVEQMGGVKDGLDAEFDRFDQSKDEYMQCDEFIKFCLEFFDGGQSRVVALKFMSNADQFDKEQEFRTRNTENGEDLSGVVVAVERAENEIMEDEFQKVRHATEDDLPLYKMVLVMPYGDRNLDSIYRFEQPDMNRVRSYIEEILTALSHLHSDRNVCHGDLAMRNIVRFNGSLRLIDMDASADIPIDDQYDGPKASQYVGLKFSSGILPPEMIAKLDTDGYNKYVAYFADEAKEASNYWKKIEPKEDDDVAYVVRTFKASEKATENVKGETSFRMEVVDKTALPYDLIPASEAVDLWSLGVLLYSLIKGQPLFDVDRNDDLKSVHAFKELFSWSDSTKTRKLNDIEDVVARDLLKKLLSRDPSDRGPLNEILDHVFFKTGKMGLDVDAELKEIKESQKRMEMNHAKQMKQLRKIEEITRHISWSIKDESRKLRKAVFEATEVNVPTCFIISPQIAEDREKMDAKVIKFFDKINDCAECIKDFSAHNLMKVVEHFTGNKTETYALYLIDEHTGDTVEPPYKVKLSGNDLADYVPIMLNGLRIFSVANKFAEVVKSVMPLAQVIPTASQDTLKKIEKNIKALSPSNPETITEAAKSEESQNFRGAKLREFEKFLCEIENEQNLNFCGLRRVCDSDGNAIWVTDHSYEMIKQIGNNELVEMRRQRDAAIAEKETAEAAIAEKETAAAGAIAEKEAAVAAAIAEKEAAVAAAIAEKEAAIAEKEAAVAAVAAAIEEKEAEIAEEKQKKKWCRNMFYK